jgi:cobalt/nickel transport protein
MRITQICWLISLLPSIAFGHFQTLLPETDIVTAAKKSLQLKLLFTHPMEQTLMQMAKPIQFGVLVNGQKQDLLSTLQPQQLADKTFYTTTYLMKTPGDYIFYVEPAPYWEPAENKMIIHYTKVIVDVFDAQQGWDASVGFPVEIEPLVRPYGVWTGNLFQGIVKHAGQPVPFTPVEVEYFNENNTIKPPAEPFVTQVIKTNANGVFSYVMPISGWWGFAALLEGKPMQNPAGKEVAVELGGLIWVKATSVPQTLLEK